ncbi:MAG: hypothetical protein R2940_17480 [Syntrophotaleaceae bacterium]
MNNSSSFKELVLGFFQHLETDRVMNFLREIELGDLIFNPWFLAGLAIFTAISVYLRRYGLLSIVLGLVGFASLVNYTLQQGTAVDGILSDTLLVFLGGGLVLIFALIYLLFIKHD